VKQLLIVFGILIVAAYLFTSPPSSVESRVTSAPPAQAESEARAPLRSSWGASLGALKNNAEAPAVKGDSSSEPNRSSRMDREELVRRSPAVTQAVVQPAPSLPSEDVALQDSPKWVTLTEPVRFRTDPNVTSPGPLYPAGSKAKIPAVTTVGWNCSTRRQRSAVGYPTYSLHQRTLQKRGNFKPLQPPTQMSQIVGKFNVARK
jgi:hypothetical protein